MPIESEFVNQSPLVDTCETTDDLTLYQVNSCSDSGYANQCTNDEFFTASQLTALQQEAAQLKLKVATLELEKLGASVNKGKRRQGNRDRQHSQEMGRRQGRDATAQECA